MGDALPGAESGREGTYQWLLRALGAYLDDQPTCRITLTEMSEGFLVRLQRTVSKIDPTVVLLRREHLVDQIHALLDKSRPATGVRHPGVWQNFPNGHQDFFRALGFEFDEAQARGILIDELEDGLVLTYSFRDPESGAWRKRMALLGVEDIEAILNAAFERRGTGATATPR